MVVVLGWLTPVHDSFCFIMKFLFRDNRLLDLFKNKHISFCMVVMVGVSNNINHISLAIVATIKYQINKYHLYEDKCEAKFGMVVVLLFCTV